MMTLGLDRLKEVKFWDFIHLRVPKRWDCIRQPRGHWGCYEEDVDSGTLWVDFDAFSLEDKFETDEEFRCLANELSEEAFNSSGRNLANTPVHEKTERNPNHRVFHNTNRAEEEGELLHFSHWHHHGIFRPRIIFVHLTFVIPVQLLEVDEIDQLLQFMDDELKNALIDW